MFESWFIESRRKMDYEESNGEGNRRIYVSNLDFKVAWQDLKDFFNEHIGDVKHADVVGKGWGTVEFGSVESAVRAINELNDTPFHGREIHIREDRLTDKAPTGNRSGIGSYSASAGFTDDKGARVYVGNLSWDISEEELIQHMSQAGEVQACEILLNASGKSKGCAIVQYKSMEEAEEAKNTLKDTDLKGRPISVREDREDGINSSGAPVPSSSRPPYPRPYGRASNFRGPGGGGGGQWHRGTKRVFVFNLSWDCSWQDLKDHFREIGNVVFTDILHTADGKSKGCGVVDFETAEAARDAIELRNNTELKGRIIYVREDRDGQSSGGHWGGPGPRWGGGGGGFKGHYNGNRNTWGNQSNNSSASREERQLLVEGLDASVDWQELKDFFNAQRADVFAPEGDVNDGKKGIVRFRTPEEADNALSEKDGALLNGKRISIRKDERLP